MPSQPQHGLALVHGCTTPELPLIPRRNDLQVTQASSGPGLFIYANLSNIGHHVEKVVGVAAHKLGLGPCAVTERIVGMFGDGMERQSKLDELHEIRSIDSNKKSHPKKTVDLDKLRGHCEALANHAHDPKETEDTQIQAFKGIIMVITRYLGIRHFFPALDTAPMANKDKVLESWHHLSDFARYCNSNDEIFDQVEKCRPSDLAVLANQDRTVIETLQSATTNSEGLEKLVAIRCLAGILDLPSFWNNPVDERLMLLVDKLCGTGVTLIDDIRVEADDILARRVVCDIDGIDLLCRAILAGVQSSCKILDAIESCAFPVDHLVELIYLLTSENVSTLFQETHCLARALTDMVGKGRKGNTTKDEEKIRIKLDTKMRPDPSQPIISLSNPIPPPTNKPFRVRWKRQVKWGDVVMKGGTKDDIVVPVMGPTRVGKSTFINNFMNENVAIVGHDLQSRTKQLKPVFWPITEPAHLKGKRLVLVDTPGFDDTYTSDSEILRRIAVWLASSYYSEMKLGGIIYLHDISPPRMLGSQHRNLAVFQELCGSNAFSSVIIGITKSGDIPPELAEKRCNELSSRHWKKMIGAGATVYKLGNDTPSARDMVTNILQNVKPTTATYAPVQAVEIQREIVDLSKLIPETNAGKRLKFSLKEVRETQKKLALDAENDVERRQEYIDAVNNLDIQIRALSIPFSHRLLAVFGL